MYKRQVQGGGGDTMGPAIAHTPIANGQTEGAGVRIIAEVSDPSGVANVSLSFRIVGDSDFSTISMSLSSGSSYSTQIPGDQVTSAGVEYYIAATDASPAHNKASSPDGAPGSVHKFKVGASNTPDRAGGCGCQSSSSAAGSFWPLMMVALLAWRRGRRAGHTAGR